MDRCRECGDRKPLRADGVCRWRGGCEHRQMRHDATMARLTAEMARLDRTIDYEVSDLRSWAVPTLPWTWENDDG